jgi:hypothetical protein
LIGERDVNAKFRLVFIHQGNKLGNAVCVNLRGGEIHARIAYIGNKRVNLRKCARGNADVGEYIGVLRHFPNNNLRNPPAAYYECFMHD